LSSRQNNEGTVRLEAEDRQLLWEEAHEPEMPAAAPEEEEVLFIDDESEAAGPEEAVAGDGADQAKDEFVTGPLALLLLQKDIEKAVKEGPEGPRPRDGPAWSEGRPVFTKPLEAPTEVAPVSTAQPPPLDMEEFTVQLKSLAEKKKLESRRLQDDRRQRELRSAREEAARREAQQKREDNLRREIRGRVRAGISEAQKVEEPAGPPVISAAEDEARMAEEEKKLESRRLQDDRRQRDLRSAREEAARREAQQKREDNLRREIRGRVRAGISEAQKIEEPAGPPGVSAAEEEARKAEDEKKLEEQRRKEERRKRWLELQKKHEVETIEDVLSKIGIK
jgi:hypothetical protein